MKATSTLVLTVILGEGLSLWALQCGAPDDHSSPASLAASPRTKRPKPHHGKNPVFPSGLDVVNCTVARPPAATPAPPLLPAPPLPAELFVFSAPPPVLAQPLQK